MVQVAYNCYSLRKITKTFSENFNIECKMSLAKLIDKIALKYGKIFKDSIIDAKSSRLKLLVLVNGASVAGKESKINNSDQLNILSFTTGG